MHERFEGTGGDDRIEVIGPADGRHGEASFSARLGRGHALLRIGAVVGAGAVLVLSAALTMAASPSPSASVGANGGSAASPGASAGPGGNGPWKAGPGMMGPGRGWLKGGGGRGMGLLGAITVTAIDGSNLSLRTTDGWTRTIAVGSSVTITRGGQTIGLGDLKVGDQIRFQETRGSDGTFTITTIEVVLPHVEGTVGAVTSNGFTVKAADGTTTNVVVTDSTTYRLGRGTGTRADVKAGDRVAVQGTKASDGTITASIVQVAPAMVAGQVTAKTSTSITVRLPGGTTTTIHVSGSTTYRVAGKTSATIADIVIGDRIVAQGTQAADGSLQATTVASMPGRGLGKGGSGMGGPMNGLNGMGGPMMAPGFEGPGQQS